MLVENGKKSTKENTNRSTVVRLGVRQGLGIIAHVLQIYLDVSRVTQNILLITILTRIASTEIRFSHFWIFTIF